MGNYKSFGDSKFIPGCSAEAVQKLLQGSAAYADNAAAVSGLWDQVGAAMFSLRSTELQLGLESDGVSTYYSANITKADVDIVKRCAACHTDAIQPIARLLLLTVFVVLCCAVLCCAMLCCACCLLPPVVAPLFDSFMEERGLSPYNTRAFKVGEGFELRFASASPDGGAGKYAKDTVDFEGVSISLVFGDYAALMQRVADNLGKASEHGAFMRACVQLQGCVS